MRWKRNPPDAIPKTYIRATSARSREASSNRYKIDGARGDADREVSGTGKANIREPEQRQQGQENQPVTIARFSLSLRVVTGV
jgi:hypothetical protein